MQNFKTSVIFILLLSIFAYGVTYFISEFFISHEYNTNSEYIDDLGDIYNVYELNKSSAVFERDLLDIGYSKTGKNRYERAYTRDTCSIIYFDDEEIVFSVMDACVSALEEKVIRDFNSDGYDLFYFVSSKENVAVLSDRSASSGGIMTYNFNDSNSTTSGVIRDEKLINKINKAYEEFLGDINAKVF